MPSRWTTDDWETPPEVFNALHEEFRFTLDPCCRARTAKCAKFFTKRDDGLTQSWARMIVYVNPPYSNIWPWVAKAYHESDHNGALVVMLLPVRTGAWWFHTYIKGRAEVRHFEGRVRFLRNGDRVGSPPFDCMVVIFRPQAKRPKTRLRERVRRAQDEYVQALESAAMDYVVNGDRQRLVPVPPERIRRRGRGNRRTAR